MSGLDHWLPSHDALTGTFALLVFAAGVVTALVIVVGAMAFRDFGMRGTLDFFLRGAAVLIVAVLAWAWLNDSATRERAAERRALDARMAELTARAISPGSALACLDGVGVEAVETACVQAIFASPQAVAAAVAYTNAGLSLLVDGLDYAAREKSYAGELERLRRGLETDRFGIVAHVLAGRGCNADECAAFKLFSDASHVKTNLRDRYFEAYVVHHATNWRSDSPISAAGAAAPTNGTSNPPAATSALPAQGTPLGSKYSFPSSASIPPVSIMSAEPTGPTPSAAPRDAPTGSTPPPAQPRRQSANRPTPKPQSPLPVPPQDTISNPPPPARP